MFGQGVAAGVDTALSGAIDIAQPTSGYVYFNKIGADLSAHNAAMDFCVREAYASLPGATVTWDGPVMEEITADLNRLLHDRLSMALAAVSIENCMVVRGWRIVRLDDAAGSELSSLPHDTLVARMTEWLGSASPRGIIVRKWNNDLNQPLSYPRKNPVFFADGQLSWKIHETKPFVSQHPTWRPEGVPYEGRPWNKVGKGWPLDKPFASLKPRDLAKAPPGSAVIVARVVSARGKLSTVTFQRLGPDGREIPSIDDHAPDFFGIATLGDQWTAWVVPPGRWRIASIQEANLCFGAPAFDVHAGDVIYAGTFDLTVKNIKPDLSLASVKSYLNGTPSAEAVGPAVYVNGSVGKCGGLNYAYEIDGAPFVPGYSRERVEPGLSAGYTGLR